jgi:two-component system LytT family response regulator
MVEAVARALIVEDEPHARRYLRELLNGEERVAIAAEASTGTEALELIRSLAPDIVFLDIQMPELGGFDLIAEVGPEKMPAVIFITGYAEYAVRAFEVDAVDYLCKPFDRERLLVSIDRAMRYLDHRERTASDPNTEARGQAQQWLSRVAIKEEAGIVFVPVEDILWIEAANKYVVIHTAIGQKHVSRQTIQSLEETLDPSWFVRIHRSVLVRKSAVRGLYPLFHGDYMVKLTTGAELTLSRTFRDAFFQQMGRRALAPRRVTSGWRRIPRAFSSNRILCQQGSMQLSAVPQTLYERVALACGITPTPLLDTMIALLPAKTVIAGAVSRVLDALESCAVPAAELARLCGTDPGATERLLRVVRVRVSEGMPPVMRWRGNWKLLPLNMRPANFKLGATHESPDRIGSDHPADESTSPASRRRT